MKILPLTTITLLPNRIRREFPTGAKADLVTSIREDGLFHPLLVREVDGRVELVAGERRWRALHDVGPYVFDGQPVAAGYAPTITLAEAFNPTRAQVRENVSRLDFTWQERAEAFAALHRIRLEETNGIQPKSRTVAELIRSRQTTQADVAELSTSLIVVEHLDDPEVAKAKSLREAEAIVARKKQAIHDATLAEMVKRSGAEHRHKLHHGTCESILPTLPAAQFDVIIADPLYGINAHKHAPASTSESAYRHDYTDSPEAAARMWHAIFTQGFRTAKPRAHLYMFHDFSRWPVLLEMATAAGWDVWPRPIVWDKGVGGMVGDYRHGPQRTYESILYALKGEKEVRGTYQEVIRLPSNADTRLNAAAKPVDLYVDLLRRSVQPGDHVLDPCCGTAPLLPAANRLNCYATGIEASETLYNHALTRLEEE